MSKALPYRIPLRMIAISVTSFFGAFLFFTPGVCSGPGLLGFETEWGDLLGLGLIFAGCLGVLVGTVWLIANWILRGTHLVSSKEIVDLHPESP